MITNYLKIQGVNLLGNQMQFVAVGAGSQTITSGLTTMTGSEFARVQITGSVDTSVPQVITITSDFNSLQISGMVLRQFGNFDNATINSGSVYMINQINGSLVCDGTIELSFEQTLTAP